MNDLAIALRTDGEKHLYEQIYDYIKGEIRKGKLRFGERLPSTRSLAEFLAVSRSTVELAYGQLLSEGYIESKPYRGYFVCQVEELFDLKEGAGWDKGFARSGKEGAQGRQFGETDGAPGMEGKTRMDAAGTAHLPYVCDFSPNAIDMAAFPYSTWKKIAKDILVGDNREMFACGSPKGDEALRETIAHYLHASRGVNCSPQQIIIGAGNDYLLMLLEKILGRDVPIAMENPTYKKAYRIFASFAYPITPVEMDGSGMCVDGLRQSGARVAYVMPSHQYPMGIVMPIGRRMELLKWAGEMDGRYLIEDDYDGEFRLKGRPIPSLQASDRLGKVIYIGTFSKSIAPAIRTGYMALPPPLLEAYEKKCSFYSTTVSGIDQRILNEFIRNGHFERHMNRMRKIYRDRHDVLLAELKEMEGQFWVTGENAGLHLLVHDRLGRSEGQLVRQAAKAGVKVYGLSEFSVGNAPFCPDGATLVLGYASLDRRQILEGMHRLKEAWRA